MAWKKGEGAKERAGEHLFSLTFFRSFLCQDKKEQENNKKVSFENACANQQVICACHLIYISMVLPTPFLTLVSKKMGSGKHPTNFRLR